MNFLINLIKFHSVVFKSYLSHSENLPLLVVFFLFLELIFDWAMHMLWDIEIHAFEVYFFKNGVKWNATAQWSAAYYCALSWCCYILNPQLLGMLLFPLMMRFKSKEKSNKIYSIGLIHPSDQSQHSVIL